MRRGFFAGVALAIPVLLASGLYAVAGPLDHNWQAALFARSERLRLFALVLDKPLGVGAAIGPLRRSLGLNQPAGAAPQRIGGGEFLAPVLSWDGNINGGYKGDTVLIGGLPFRIDAPYRAHAGIVAGLRGGVSRRWAIAPGTTLDLRLNGSFVRAPRFDENVTTAQSALCLEHGLGPTLWTTGCGGSVTQLRTLSTTREQFVSFGVGGLVAAPFGPSVIEATYRHSMNPGWTRDSLRLSSETARRGLGVVSLSASLGERVTGQNSELFSFGVGLTRPIAGQVTSLAVELAKTGGARFLGQERRDKNLSLSITRAISPDLSATVGAVRTRSSITAFSGSELNFSVNYTGWSRYR